MLLRGVSWRLALRGRHRSGVASAQGRRLSGHALGAGEEVAASDGMMSAYQSLLDRGAVQPDASQASAARLLQLLQDAVLLREARAGAQGPGPSSGPAGQGASDGSSADGSAGGGAAAAAGSHPPPAVRGAYLWGPVGCGKTLLMDTFFASTRRALERQQQREQQQAPLHTARGSQQGQQPQTCDGAATTAAPAAAAGGGPRSAVRAHFHEFMQGVHGRLHALQQERPRVVARSRQGLLVYRYAEPEEDPLLTVARELGSYTAVLCLDELHVTDVADAMILARLFGALMTQHSTALLFTSNRPPRELYKGGLSRKYFEPFVHLVDEQMVVAAVGAGVDYRRAAAPPAAAAAPPAGAESGGAAAASPAAEAGLAFQQGSWRVGPEAEDRLRQAWQQHLTASGGGGGLEVPLAYGRTLKVPNAGGDAAYLTFEQLCGERGLRAGMDDGGALAAPDYLALCRRFRTLFVAGVPRLGPAQRDEARRLVTLLDVAYDNRCRLEAAAAVAPDEMFADLLEAAARQGVNPRLGLPKTSPSPPATAVDAGKPTTGAASSAPEAPTSSASASESAGPVPAASVTAALHMGLGPSMTHGSALTNTIHPSEFTGSGSATAFAVGPPQPPSPQQPPSSQQQQGGGGAQGAGAGGRAGGRALPADLLVPRAVLSEEVLMYHRAASRLAEMCRLDGQ